MRRLVLKSDLGMFITPFMQSGLCLRDEYLYTFVCPKPSSTVKPPQTVSLSVTPVQYHRRSETPVSDQTPKRTYRALRCSNKWPDRGCCYSVLPLLGSRHRTLPLLHHSKTKFYPRDLSAIVPISDKTSLKHAGGS